MGMSLGAYYTHQNEYTIYFSDKTRVHMFYFVSYTTVPLQCAALFFWDSVH